MATAFGFAAATAVSTSSGVNTSPHPFSTFVTSTPIREASSAMRWPKKPAAHTTSRSPGSRRLPSTASMPAMPVPETARVSLVGRAEGASQQAARVVEQAEELRVEVAEHRRAEGPHHARVHGARARAQQQPRRRVELVEDVHGRSLSPG